MKLVLGIEVGLSPGDFVLDGTQSDSPKKGRSPLPNFRPISTVATRLDASRCHLATRYGGRPPPRQLCSMGTQHPQKMAHPPHPILAHVYCGYGRPSQLLASSCYISREASTAKAKCILVTTVCVSVCLTAEVNFFVIVRVCRFHCV